MDIDLSTPDWISLDRGLLSAAGLFDMPVLVSGTLSDILEVPPEWQELESYSARSLGLLRTMRVEWAERQMPFTFRYTIPDQLTHAPREYELTAALDDHGVSIEIAGEGR